MPKPPRQPKKPVKYPPHPAEEINPLEGIMLDGADAPVGSSRCDDREPSERDEKRTPQRSVPTAPERKEERPPGTKVPTRLKPYFEAPGLWLYQNNCLEVMDAIAAKHPEGRFDMIFADPPYFLSNGGITCHAGKMVSVHKGDWDKSRGWEWNHEFNTEWLRRCQRVLKPNGTLWVIVGKNGRRSAASLPRLRILCANLRNLRMKVWILFGP